MKSTEGFGVAIFFRPGPHEDVKAGQFSRGSWFTREGRFVREETDAELRRRMSPPLSLEFTVAQPKDSLGDELAKLAHDAVKEVLRKLEPEIGTLVGRGAAKIRVVAWLEGGVSDGRFVVKGAAVEEASGHVYDMPKEQERILDRVLEVTEDMRGHYRRVAAIAKAKEQNPERRCTCEREKQHDTVTRRDPACPLHGDAS